MSSSVVWIIDDCKLARRLIARAVVPWTSRLFDSGAETLLAFAEGDSPPIAVIIDEQMPGLRGTVIARAMRDSDYNGVIILLTGTISDTLRACAREARIDSVAQKPLCKDAVHAILSAAERRGLGKSA